jgi:hypothetical protein
MTYVCIHTGPGLTIDDFRAVCAKHNPPQDIDGLLAWAAGSDENGLHVVSVWQSQAHTDRFAAEQLFPAFQALGLMSRVDDTPPTTYDADEFYLRS